MFPLKELGKCGSEGSVVIMMEINSISVNTGVMMCEELKPQTIASQHTECHRSGGTDQDRSQSHVVN